jgi:hypothetical protein
VVVEHTTMQHVVLNLRVGGLLAEQLTQIARKEQNSVSAVARSLIAVALGVTDNRRVTIQSDDDSQAAR